MNIGKLFGVDIGDEIRDVDQPQFDKVEAIRKRWASKKNYKVLESDCVSFTGEVATALGLKTPRRAEARLPVTYVEKLYQLNK